MELEEPPEGARTTRKGPGRVPQAARLQAHSVRADRGSTADLGAVCFHRRLES